MYRCFPRRDHKADREDGGGKNAWKNLGINAKAPVLPQPPRYICASIITDYIFPAAPLWCKPATAHPLKKKISSCATGSGMFCCWNHVSSGGNINLILTCVYNYNRCNPGKQLSYPIILYVPARSKLNKKGVTSTKIFALKGYSLYYKEGRPIQ